MNAPIEPMTDQMALQEALTQPDLASLQAFLSKQMAVQKVQAVIRGDGLNAVSERILNFARSDRSLELLAAAALARIAAVAGTRESYVTDLIPGLFSVRPRSIEELSKGDDKAYAAVAVALSKSEWQEDYCIEEALIIDTAEEARKVLLASALETSASLSRFLRLLEVNSLMLYNFPNYDSRMKRVRRIFSAVSEVLIRWQGTLGHEPGTALGDCLAAYLRGDAESAEAAVLTDVIDSGLTILGRMIQRRFSCAFDANSYAIVERAQQAVRIGWHEFLSRSSAIRELRSDLLEAALVLARQNRTDSRIMEVIVLAFGSRAQAASAIGRHFSGAQDADPEVRAWWIAAGVVERNQRTTEHTFGNNEDQQIGSLLIEMESIKEPMEKLSRAVVPLLEISDPVLASTMRNAAAGYAEIAQTTRRLARMRKLSKTDLKGERMEYNPLEHEMIGGHQPGVRSVRVERDGIRKEFGGKVKTLVKPWVKPEE